MQSAITTDETTDLSIEQIFSEPFSMPVGTSNPNVELSARSCLFRPCMQRVSLHYKQHLIIYPYVYFVLNFSLLQKKSNFIQNEIQYQIIH